MPALVWEVQVAGSASDLAHLSRWFRGPPTVVWFDERDLCYLVGDDSFQQLEESSEVWVAAGEVLAVLSGVLKLIRNADETLKTGAVYLRHPDGRRDVFVSLTPAAIRLEAGEAVACVTSKDGRTVMLSSPSSPTRSLATAARTDLLVSKALRLYGSDGSSWVGLYRVHEVIEEDVGDERRMLRRAWG